MRGLDKIRSMPFDSAAERRRLRLKLLSTDPNVSPIAPPLPAPTAAGKFTAKFGLATVGVNGDRPAVGATPVGDPPTMPMLFGNATPVGFPVAAENVASPPHCTPKSRR